MCAAASEMCEWFVVVTSGCVAVGLPSCTSFTLTQVRHTVRTNARIYLHLRHTHSYINTNIWHHLESYHQFAVTQLAFCT